MTSAANRRHCIAVGGICTLTVLIAWPHLGGEVTFLGDSDRLNTFLNVKLAEVTALQEFGRVPAWSANSFMGFNLRGLYWMLPGANPDAYIHAALPIEDAFRNAGTVSFLLLFAAMLSAYRFLFEIASSARAAAVGAAMYGCSALSLGRLAQVDSAYFTIILLPLAMLSVRRACAGEWRRWLILYAAAAYAMLALAFLQEAAYALALFWAYALFRSWIGRSVFPTLVVAIGSIAAALAAAPRIMTVAQEFGFMFRTTQPSYTGPNEVLRLLHDGIFGRYWEEAWDVIGNVGYNVHEGVQIYSSTIATCLVLLLVLMLQFKRHGLPLLALMAVFVCVAYQIRPALGVASLIGAAGVSVIAYRFKDRGFVLAIEDDREFAFHLVTFALVVGFVLLPYLRAVLYYAFFKIDFLHSRVVIVALLPLSSIVALTLAGLLGPGDTLGRSQWIWVAAGLAFLAVVHVGLHEWQASAELSERKISVRHLNLNAAVLLRIVILAAIVAIAIALVRCSDRPSTRRTIAMVLSAAIVLECFFYARERLLGEHTRTYPTAFRNGNYFSAPAGVMNPPSRSCREALAKRLDNAGYRTVAVADVRRFQPFVAPHLAQFWNLRLLDGYPGLPRRLAELPWPEGVAGLRSIGFRQEGDLPWRLLGILNVKSAIVVTPDLYFNTGSPDVPCSSLNGLAVVANPKMVLPRHFFVEEIRPVPQTAEVQPVEMLEVRAIAGDAVEVRWWPKLIDGDVDLQIRRPEEREFSTVARHSPLGNRRQTVRGLGAGIEYEFRVTRTLAGGSRFISSPIKVVPVQGTTRSESMPDPDVDSLVRRAFPFDTARVAMVEGLQAPRRYDASGNVRAIYAGDVATFEFDPVDASRYLVVNELFHPMWRAYVDGREIPIAAANRVMRGVEIPPRTRALELRFEPFSARPISTFLMLAAVAILAAAVSRGDHLRRRRRVG